MKRLFFFLAIIYTSPLVACQCMIDSDIDMIGSLWEHYDYEDTTYRPTIVKGVIVDYGIDNQYAPYVYPISRLKILDQLSGINTVEDTITLYGDSGINCFATISPYYGIGDTMLAIVEKSFIPTNLPDNPIHYFITSCGYHHVLIKNNMVYGGQWGSFTSQGVSYQTFMDTLLQTLEDLVNPPIVPIEFAVYPNPVTEMLHISHPDTTATLRIYNTLGQEIGTYTLWEQHSEISLTHLPSGIYLYLLEQKRRLIHKGKFYKH